MIGSISQAQFISIVILAAASGLYFWRSRQASQEELSKDGSKESQNPTA